MTRTVSGFEIGGFWSTIGGAAIVWIVNATLKRLQRRPRPDEVASRWERW
jgi:hypothetical protein